MVAFARVRLIVRPAPWEQEYQLSALPFPLVMNEPAEGTSRMCGLRTCRAAGQGLPGTARLQGAQHTLEPCT